MRCARRRRSPCRNRCGHTRRTAPRRRCRARGSWPRSAAIRHRCRPRGSAGPAAGARIPVRRTPHRRSAHPRRSVAGPRSARRHHPMPEGDSPPAPRSTGTGRRTTPGRAARRPPPTPPGPPRPAEVLRNHDAEQAHRGQLTPHRRVVSGVPGHQAAHLGLGERLPISSATASRRSPCSRVRVSDTGSHLHSPSAPAGSHTGFRRTAGDRGLGRYPVETVEGAGNQMHPHGTPADCRRRAYSRSSSWNRSRCRLRARPVADPRDRCGARGHRHPGSAAPRYDCHPNRLLVAFHSRWPVSSRCLPTAVVEHRIHQQLQHRVDLGAVAGQQGQCRRQPPPALLPPMAIRPGRRRAARPATAARCNSPPTARGRDARAPAGSAPRRP